MPFSNRKIIAMCKNMDELTMLRVESRQKENIMYDFIF